MGTKLNDHFVNSSKNVRGVDFQGPVFLNRDFTFSNYCIIILPTKLGEYGLLFIITTTFRKRLCKSFLLRLSFLFFLICDNSQCLQFSLISCNTISLEELQAEVYVEPSRTSTTELFVKKVNCF